MRFGAFVPQGWRLDLVGLETSQHWDTMTSVARTLESTGYESLWVYDHFHTVPEPTQEVTYEAWTLMAALAAVPARTHRARTAAPLFLTLTGCLLSLGVQHRTRPASPREEIGP